MKKPESIRISGFFSFWLEKKFLLTISPAAIVVLRERKEMNVVIKDEQDQHSIGDWLTTEQLSEVLHVKPQTIRAGYCRQGHYCQIVPKKMPNRRLLWPVNPIKNIFE